MIGLVLSGGGAKGAYQAGVIKAMAELDCQVDAISGASIGALNGAIIAQSKNLNEAANKLQNLWLDLSKEFPVKANDINIKSIYLSLMSSVGAIITPEMMIINKFIQFLSEPKEETGIIKDNLITNILQDYINPEKFDDSLPLYISVYESSGNKYIDILDYVKASFNRNVNRSSTFIKIQDIPHNERLNLLIASAAIPIVFGSKKIGGKNYYDGGMGQPLKAQGNTPITPLTLANYKQIYVSHLSDGSLWSRHDFPNTSIIEIRPQSNRISRSTKIGVDLLGFSSESIRSWISQGYDDAMYSISKIKKSLEAHELLSTAKKELHSALSNVEDTNQKLNEIMKDFN